MKNPKTPFFLNFLLSTAFARNLGVATDNKYFSMLRKFILTVNILLFICKYFIEKIINYIWLKYFNSLLQLELISLLLVIFFAFLIYYFIVIELSILLFGYSLLCYWFLFIIITTCIILTWQLESNFLKFHMWTSLHLPFPLWVKYYRNENPLSFYDFLTNYKKRPLLFWLLVKSRENDLFEIKTSLFTFYFFLIFFFFYACVYRYDPYFVKFVVKFFHPIVNFFETRRNPRFEDFSSALIWFWNRIFSLFEVKYKNSEKFKFFKKITKPSLRLENWAHVKRANKISLRKWGWFSDLHYLRALSLYPPARQLVFTLDQPILSAIWFDPNWKLLFLRYISSQYNSDTKNFWKKHFFNNLSFWRFLEDNKINLNQEVEDVDKWLLQNFSSKNSFSNLTDELLLQQNYFEDHQMTSQPFVEKFGFNREFYFNLLRNTDIKKTANLKELEEIFTSPVSYSFPPTLSGLLAFHWKNKNSTAFQNIKNLIYDSKETLGVLLNQTKLSNLANLLSMYQYTLDVPVNMYSTMEEFSFDWSKTIALLLEKPISNDQMTRIYLRYNHWLSALEHSVGLYEWGSVYSAGRWITLGFINNMLHSRLDWIDFILNDQGFGSFLYMNLPSYEGLRYWYVWFFNPAIFYRLIWWKVLKDMGWKEEELDKWDAHLYLPYKMKFSKRQINSFLEAEKRLELLEVACGLWSPGLMLGNQTVSNIKSLGSSEDYPWYIKTFDYLIPNDARSILPGFIWYYYPTPYPLTFSTVGIAWNKYQYYWKNTSSTLVGYSDNISDLRASMPFVLYSGVEAILYIKPLLDLIDYFIKIFINIISYPIELIVTQNIFSQLTSLTSLAVFIHFIWFLHFYIYLLFGLYLLYYFLIFYYKRVGFKWSYEWSTEELFLHSYSNHTYWYSLTDIWKSYRTPKEMFLLSLQTNLLLYYTFYDQIPVLIKGKVSFYPILNLFIRLLDSKLKNYSYFFSIFDWKKKMLYNTHKDLFIFRSFFTITSIRYTPLLFTGGSNISTDQLVWSYFDYLSQFSVFLSRGLQRNYYNITIAKSKFSSEMWQLTILFSSLAPTENLLFLSQPVLDSNLAWLLFTNFAFSLRKLIFNSAMLDSNLFFQLDKNKIAIMHALFLNFKFELHRNSIKSGLDIYSFFWTENISFLTKYKTNTFWDDQRYWLLAFFRSFRFLPKMQYPSVNVHSAYESTWLHLSWIAYANSWICQSTYVRPFFNIIQHLWWTSRLYGRASNLISSSDNLNQPGINTTDNLRNFLEKRYSFQTVSKTETVFGFVWTLSLNWYPKIVNNHNIPYENWNFDLSFPNSLIQHWTTDWGYAKTNLPLNLCELDLGPYDIFRFFETLPTSYLFLYLSFPFQPELWIFDKPEIFWNLQTEFVNFFKDSKKWRIPSKDLATRYMFQFKEFDLLLRKADNNSKNLVFSFDVSYFFSHFTTWDYFSYNVSELWSQIFLPADSTLDTEILSLFQANQDMLAMLDHETNWFKKPFGVLDKLELHSMKKYKSVKLLDELSFSWKREDPFLSLDSEHTKSRVGLSVYPKLDPKNLLKAYSEKFPIQKSKWFPYNPNILKSKTKPLIIGWVGDIYANTIRATNLMYSLLYANPDVKPDALTWLNPALFLKILHTTKKFFVKSFFAVTKAQQQLFSRSFSWLNIAFHPASFWWSLGIKAKARLDFWSWKCGFELDYKNGLYSYWPYLGFRHSFFSRLTAYDSMYGFYWSYYQIFDNPLLIDPSTSAYQHFKPANEETLFEDIAKAHTVNPLDENLSDPALDRKFSVPYWEVYYSMQHPYFIGYLLFWFLVFFSKSLYLGINNHSYKRFVAFELFYKELDFSFFENEHLLLFWTSIENRFWKQMFLYWRYFINPTKLTSVVDYFNDDTLLQWTESEDILYKFFCRNEFLTRYLVQTLKLSTPEIIFFLDFKLIPNTCYSTNWLTTDLPFTLSPFLIINFTRIPLSFTSTILHYKLFSFSFSKFNTLKENINFNVFYDWSSGCYLDLLNFASYMSAVRGSGLVHSGFYSSSSFIAATFVWFKKDWSVEFAKELIKKKTDSSYSDILLDCDLSLHNLALLFFFSDAFSFLISINAHFIWQQNIRDFLKFYIADLYSSNFKTINLSSVPNLWSKISAETNKPFSKTWELIFLYNLQKSFSQDVVFSLVRVSSVFSNKALSSMLFWSLWFWLSTRYTSLWSFYNWIGHYLPTFFFTRRSK